MLNKEKYAKEILDIVCQDGENPAIINNTPTKCDDVQCSKCKLYYYGSCARGFAEWANSEYKEHEIDWNKVPVDTPVYVRDDSSNDWNKRHFCKFDSDNNLYSCYFNGNTSWSNENILCGWKQCKLAEGVDCSEWYKD